MNEETKKIETKPAKKSWKTSISGWAIFAGALMTALGFLLDGNPETSANWQAVSDGLQVTGVSLSGIAGGLLGKFSRDDNVSSKENGAE